MKKELIEQIEKIKGVKTVHGHPEIGKVVVEFEAQKSAVECTNRDQLVFCYERNNTIKFVVKDTYGIVYIDGFDTWDREKDCAILMDYSIISFDQYLIDHNLTDKWVIYLLDKAEKRYPRGTKIKCAVDGEESITQGGFCYSDCHCGSIYAASNRTNNQFVYASGKWADIVPCELVLVDGEIYVTKFKKDKPTIFRHGVTALDCSTKCFYDDGDIDGVTCVGGSKTKTTQATPKQKRKLIRAEIKNNYFHELNVQKG